MLYLLFRYKSYIYTEGKMKRRVNSLGDLILFIRMFFSILIHFVYKDKFNQQVFKVSLDFDQ